MPSAAWIAASKKTPMEPVFYAACESVDAINVTQKLASDWTAGDMAELETFDLPGGGAGIRPKLYTYTNSQLTWQEWYVEPAEYGGADGNAILNPLRTLSTGQTPWFTAPTAGFLYSVQAKWEAWHQVYQPDMRKVSEWATVHVYSDMWVAEFRTAETHTMSMLAMGEFAAGASVPCVTTAPDFHDTTFGTYPGSPNYNISPTNDANFLYSFRAKVGTITTAPFDLGVVPNVNSRVLIEDMVTGSASIVYSAEGSTTGSGGWVNLGNVVDGSELAPYRYYRLVITFTSTGYDTPELYSIRIVGGNRQTVYLGDHRGEPALASGEVNPYLHSVSSANSKIALKDKPTVGDCTITLAWTPETSELVQSTGKRRSVTLYLGFTGLPIADYEPYFTGFWESYSADQDKRTFTVKLRDVWKRFKKKVPEQQSRDGQLLDINLQFGQSAAGAGSVQNIIDSIIQVADLSKAPDRFIDRAGLSTLKAAHYNGSEWNVYRVLTEQKDSDDLLKELSVTAGLFLVPRPNGKLTALHYDTLAAAEPAVTLDAAQIRFTSLVPDMAETVTRHNIYFNLIEDSQGRRSGGSPSDYSHIYTTVGSTNSIIAERDREETITGEWFDNWGLAAGVANGVPNPLTRLADRLESWYTPITTVNGKQVSTTKVSVKAENVPLRYWSDVFPGSVVYVDNLRLPCPVAEWGGFSDQVKFLVMSWNVDPKNFTLALELFQITPLAYNQSPTWATYSRRDLVPAVTGLTVIETAIAGADGIARPGVAVSFVPVATLSSGSYEIWVSEGGTAAKLFATIPTASAGSSVTVVVPALSGVDYTVTVNTVTDSGVRLGEENAPSGTVTPAASSQITDATLKLLNPEADDELVDDYFAGRKSFISVLDTRSMVFELGVVGPGVTATYTDAIAQASSEMNLNKTLLQSLNSMVSGLITSEYSATTTYTVGQFVKMPSGDIYQCILESTGHEPPNTTYWLPTSDLVTLVNDIQQELDTATATWTSTAQQLTADIAALDDPVTGRVSIAETQITQNATNIEIAGSSITGPLAFVAGAVVQPGVQIESPADVTGLEVQVSRTRINLDSANAAITLGATRLDSLTGRMSVAEVEIDGANATILLQTGQISAMDGRVSAAEIAIDGANAAIALRATQDELQGEVDILSEMIGLKLDAGPISAGLAIEWTDGTHTKSRITAFSDTFRISRPDGTGARTIFATGMVDGVDAVGISGDLFIDGTVSARTMSADVFIGENFIGETFTGNTFQTSGTGERFVVSHADNLARFFGDRGDGVIEEIVTMGAATSGGDRRGVYAILNYGPKSTNQNPFQFGAIEGANNATRNGAIAVMGTSDTLPAVGGMSNSGPGVVACSYSGYSVDAFNGNNWTAIQGLNIDNKAPLRIRPSRSSSAPTHTADIGAEWSTSTGDRYTYTSTGWRKYAFV